MFKSIFIISIIYELFFFMILFSCMKLLKIVVHLFRLDKDVLPNADYFYKYKSFENFFNKAKPCFRFIYNKDVSIKEISEQYHFHICPGGSNGGLYKTIVEVFWGNRPYDTKTSIKNNFTSTEVLIERGAKLCYSRLDNGNVLVLLYPAMTEYISRNEQAVVIDYLTEPEKLSNIGVLRKHWRYLKAYMNVSSLCGFKSIYDRCIVFCLINFNTLIIDNKTKKSKALKLTFKIFKTAVTVGLSGFLLAIIQWYMNKNGK